MLITPKIESLLLVSIRPLSVKELMDKLEVKKKEAIESSIEELMVKYNQEGSGINIQRIDDKIQMVTSKENSEMISEYLKSEVSGELTPASLETLTVIAYRGPITKTELELIRGVNCSLILRNLLIRGLIEERKSTKDLVSSYQITFDFLQYLGLTQASELPDFAALNSNENLQNLLKGEVSEQEAATPEVATDLAEEKAEMEEFKEDEDEAGENGGVADEDDDDEDDEENEESREQTEEDEEEDEDEYGVDDDDVDDDDDED